MLLPPIVFYPVYQERLWGGRALWRVLSREVPYEHTAESWEISTHQNGVTAMANGPLIGKSILDLTEPEARAMLGRADRVFPLLVKIIAAEQDLSIQVHPDDELAASLGSQGKTEVWFVLHAEPGARIIYGTKPGATRERLRAAAAGGDILSCLDERPVRAGDFIPLPAGSIHALGAGIMVAEIQQNSDTTYRLYDWDRCDQQGNRRPLHIEEGLAAIKPDLALPSAFAAPRADGGQLFGDEHFSVHWRAFSGARRISGVQQMFRLWTVTGGTGTILAGNERIPLRTGCSLLLPAHGLDFLVQGDLTLLETRPVLYGTQ